jgi:gluconate 2-dehydrogenase gamma chain
MDFRTKRRAFLKAAGAVPAAAVAAPLRFEANPAAPGRTGYLSAEETAFVDAAVARLIPADDLGPGAKEAGVTTFIDRQLAGPYGRAQTWYMRGPWREGTEQQGYQLKLSPAQVYRAAIKEVDAYCRKNYSGKPLAQLDAAAQDKVLEALEKGDLAFESVPAKTFFDMLWSNTQEGFLADPMYGGNRGFVGWKLIGFPGPRYNYVTEIAEFGKRYTQPTVGILGRDPSLRIG